MAESPVIGAVTVGQAPREDVLDDIAGLLPDASPVVQAGALDDLTAAELARLSCPGGPDVLVTRLRDGSEQTLPASAAVPLLQRAVDKVAAQHATCIAVLCTESFDGLRSPVPLLFPATLARQHAARAAAERLGVIVPAAAQVTEAERAWAGYGGTVRVEAASPYGASDDLDRAARDLAGWRPDLVVLDCIGFTRDMQRQVKQATGARIILPRVALAWAIADA
jgi:protein AroM